MKKPWYKRIFNKPKPHTALHPDYKKLIEPAFEIEGRQFYAFKNMLDMPHLRYMNATKFSTEFEMRITASTLSDLLEKAIDNADKGNFTKVISILAIIKEKTDMLISLNASYRLASCVYFYIDENLDDYDYDIGDEKIKLFKEYGIEDFFFGKPMKRFIPDLDISAKDLKLYSQYERELNYLVSQRLKDENGSKKETTG